MHIATSDQSIGASGEAREKIKVMHDKVKTDFESSGFYKKSKRLANISRSGSTKGVRL